MTFCACSIPSAYDFTFALPSALYEPILALAWPYNTLPLRFIAIPFRSHPTPFLCLSYPYKSFTIQFNSVTTQSSSAPAHRVALPFLYHTVPFHRFTILFCSIAWALLIITITALAVSFPLQFRLHQFHNATVLFYSIAALHFTLPSPRLSRPFLAVAPLRNSMPRRYPSSRISAIAFCISSMGR